MQLRSFLVGAGVAVLATIAAAIATDMPPLGVVGLAVSVWVAAQILYVGLVAYLARRNAQDDAAGSGTGTRAADRRERAGSRSGSAQNSDNA